MLTLECKPFWKCLRIQLEWQRQSKHHKRSRHAGCTCWCVPCVASTGRDRLLLTEWSHGLFRLKWQIGTCHFLRLKLREPTHEHFHNITLITLITSLQIFEVKATLQKMSIVRISVLVDFGDAHAYRVISKSSLIRLIIASVGEWTISHEADIIEIKLKTVTMDYLLHCFLWIPHTQAIQHTNGRIHHQQWTLLYREVIIQNMLMLRNANDKGC